jgi:hypothetical protein
MATFSNTFTYFANTGNLDFDVSITNLNVYSYDAETKIISNERGTANNYIELSLFYGLPFPSSPSEYILEEGLTNSLGIANTISIPTGVDFVEWQLKYTDISSTGTANGIIEIANFEYEELSQTWNIDQKQTLNLFDISLDITELEPTSNIFCCLVSCQENIELSDRHVNEIFETDFNQNIYLPFPKFVNRKEIYSANTISSQVIPYRSSIEDIGKSNYSSIFQEETSLTGKLLLYLGVQNGKMNDTVTASSTITPVPKPTTCDFDLQEENFFIQNAKYNANTGKYDTETAFLIGLQNVTSSDYSRFCEVHTQNESTNQKQIIKLSDENSYTMIASAQEETKFTFSAFDSFGNQTANQLSANCQYQSAPPKIYKLPDYTPKEPEVLRPQKVRMISFIRE